MSICVSKQKSPTHRIKLIQVTIKIESHGVKSFDAISRGKFSENIKINVQTKTFYKLKLKATKLVKMFLIKLNLH